MKRRLATSDKRLDEDQCIDNFKPSYYDASIFVLFKWAESQEKVTNKQKVFALDFDLGTMFFNLVLDKNPELLKAFEVAF